MAEYRNRNRILYPLGVTQEENGVHILVQGRAGEVRLLLYRPGEKKPCEEISFDPKYRMGDVWELALDRTDFTSFEYNFMIDGKIVTDPNARVITGREKWADRKRAGKPVRGRILSEEFDWEDDVNPETPYAETILYKLHVRGFTAHASSGVSARGTYAGVMEKIPYLKELGITAVELMPVTEFDEIMMSSSGSSFHNAKQEPTGYLNYWGYGPSYLYAVKTAYASRETMSAEGEFKTLVKELHKAGIECIPEMYFTGKELPGEILSVARYWVEEYHVDGFHLTGFPDLSLAAEDPFLKRTKLFAENWNEVMNRRPKQGYVTPGDGAVSVEEKNLAEYNMQFMEDMRRFLKGDEGMLSAFEFRNRRNPAEYAVIDYMANTNGFTLMDTVSYDRKHNEKNGEENRDGSDYNYSWNCGAEGPTRKKKIVELRKQLLKNAYLLLFLSQGVPLLMAGDEFGNSQDGNNNAYCQDNAVSWLNWKLLETHKDQVDFVKRLIAFRKAHKMFHMDREPRIMDYKSCGRPDVSYHGENAWKPEFENFRRQFGILYWGAYAKRSDGSDDANFYVAYNMHWEPHMFGLPHLPKGARWRVICSTADPDVEDIPADGTGETLKNQMMLAVPPRGIMILESFADPDGEKEAKHSKGKKEKMEKTEKAGAAEAKKLSQEPERKE
ncbi:MAG: alpha-amylase family glycosyl hydrolase [Pilosibacter sp.]